MSFDWEAIGVVGSMAAGAIMWVYRSINGAVDYKIGEAIEDHEKDEAELRTDVKLLQQKTDQIGKEVSEVKEDVKYLVRRSMSGSTPLPPLQDRK